MPASAFHGHQRLRHGHATVRRAHASRSGAAMIAASGDCVDMMELQAGACRVIARVTGAQAGIVTSGASAAMLLGAAACLAGLDPARMNRLPEVADGRNATSSSCAASATCTTARIACGRRPHRRGRHSRPLQRPRRARRRSVGDGGGDHAGHRGYLLSRAPAIAAAAADVAAVAREHGIPLLVDAAAQLPPADNLRRFLTRALTSSRSAAARRSADRRPRASCAAAPTWCASALLQMLDLDVFPGPLAARRRSSRRCRQLPGLPQHGIGRSCKVGKEEIIGLLVALERFVASNDAARRAEWCRILEDNPCGSGRHRAWPHPRCPDTAPRDHHCEPGCSRGASRSERSANPMRTWSSARRRAAVFARVAHRRAGHNHRQATTRAQSGAPHSELSYRDSTHA